MKKRLLIVFITILALLCGAYLFIMYGGKRNLESEKSFFTVTSIELFREYNLDIDASNKKYLEKAISVSGKIISVKNKEIILQNSIVCNLKNADASLKKNQHVVIKGRVVGYDDLMEEIKLDQCLIINNSK